LEEIGEDRDKQREKDRERLREKRERPGKEKGFKG
jgi:hypothetical protein